MLPLVFELRRYRRTKLLPCFFLPHQFKSLSLLKSSATTLFASMRFSSSILIASLTLLTFATLVETHVVNAQITEELFYSGDLKSVKVSIIRPTPPKAAYS